MEAITESRGNAIWKQLHRRIMSAAKRRYEGGMEEDTDDVGNDESIYHDPVYNYVNDLNII